MNIRKRAQYQNKAVGSAPKNTVSRRVDGETQAASIKNCVNKPSAVGPSKVRNAVNGPS